MKYKLLKAWLDLKTNQVHENVGEILEINDKARADFLVEKEILEAIDEAPAPKKTTTKKK